MLQEGQKLIVDQKVPNVVRGKSLSKPRIYSFDLAVAPIPTPTGVDDPATWGWCALEELNRAVNARRMKLRFERNNNPLYLFPRFAWLNRIVIDRPLATWICGETFNYLSNDIPNEDDLSLGVFVPAGWAMKVIDLSELGITNVEGMMERITGVLIGDEPLSVPRLVGYHPIEGRFEVLSRDHGVRLVPLSENGGRTSNEAMAAQGI